MDHGKPLALIRPDLAGPEARAGEHAQEFGQRVLVAVFGVDGLAGREMPQPLRPAHDQRAARAQVHLDARMLGVEEGHMLPVVRVEVAAQQAVDVAEQVQVEARRHALGIVIGGLQPLRGLGQIYADQQAAVVVDHGTHLAQHALGLYRVEIADGRARIEQQPPGLRDMGRQGQRLGDVGRDGMGLQLRKFLGQPAHGLAQERTRNVHAHEMPWPQAAAQGAHLLAIAGAQLDQHLAAAQGLGHGSARVGQDGGLGARGVVLGQPRDLLEQVAAARVVEVFGRDLGLGLHQPVLQFGAGRAQCVVRPFRGHLAPAALGWRTRRRRQRQRHALGARCQGRGRHGRIVGRQHGGGLALCAARRSMVNAASRLAAGRGRQGADSQW